MLLHLPTLHRSHACLPFYHSRLAHSVDFTRPPADVFVDKNITFSNLILARLSETTMASSAATDHNGKSKLSEDRPISDQETSGKPIPSVAVTKKESEKEEMSPERAKLVEELKKEMALGKSYDGPNIGEVYGEEYGKLR